MKTITSILPESAETKPEEIVNDIEMKRKTDWIAIGAAISLGFLAHLMLTSESVIFPAFAGAIMLNCLVARIMRRF